MLTYCLRVMRGYGPAIAEWAGAHLSYHTVMPQFRWSNGDAVALGRRASPRADRESKLKRIQTEDEGRP
jgi:hypothetical protein